MVSQLPIDTTAARVQTTDDQRSERDYGGLQNYPEEDAGGAERGLYVTLRGRPVNREKTGAWKAGPFVYAFVAGNSITILLLLTLVTYLTTYLHQSISKASTIITNFSGTNYLLSILGAFIADSGLGSFRTLLGGVAASILGLGLYTLLSADSSLHLQPCAPNAPCSPAGARYMGPLYVALYTIAVGAGLANPNLLSLGADQFDDSVPAEKKQSVHFFAWFFFFTHISFLISLWLGVYLVTDVSPGWGYGFSLMWYVFGFLIFLTGTPKLRHRRSTGSFITRMAQVVVASLFKRNAPIVPVNVDTLYDPAVPQSTIPKADHTNSLRILDRAAVMTENDKDLLKRNQHPNPWRLCSLSQVEECKRIIQLLPVWVGLCAIAVVYAQLTTFTISQAETFDRNLGPHFTIPAACIPGILTLTSLIALPIYDQIVAPFVSRFTKNPYGFTPLQRLGSTIIFCILTMMTAALVERRRLKTVRELHLENMILGSYGLPLKFWWLVPQFVVAAFVEMSFFISAYEFFYHESSDSTRSIGSSFTYSAYAMGSFFSTVLVEIVNKVTRHQQGGSWLEGQLNNGGLEKYYWLLVVLLSVNFVFYVIVAHFYRYKYDWYHVQPSKPVQQSRTDVELTNAAIKNRCGID